MRSNWGDDTAALDVPPETRSVSAVLTFDCIFFSLVRIPFLTGERKNDLFWWREILHHNCDIGLQATIGDFSPNVWLWASVKSTSLVCRESLHTSRRGTPTPSSRRAPRAGQVPAPLQGAAPRRLLRWTRTATRRCFFLCIATSWGDLHSASSCAPRSSTARSRTHTRRAA